MNNWGIGRVIRLLVAIACFVMAVLSYFGVISQNSPGDQRLFAGLWTLAGVLWILRISLSAKRKRTGDDSDGQ
jgi:peptidoglycan/LPS O-acetylase OafA/YrhL